MSPGSCVRSKYWFSTSVSSFTEREPLRGILAAGFSSVLSVLSLKNEGKRFGLNGSFFSLSSSFFFFASPFVGGSLGISSLNVLLRSLKSSLFSGIDLVNARNSSFVSFVSPSSREIESLRCL